MGEEGEWSWEVYETTIRIYGMMRLLGHRLLLRWMLKAGYIRFLRQHHYPHHRYSDCNFNLLLGGDVVLGRYRVPTAQDWDEMCRLGLVVDDGRRRARCTLILP